MLKAIAVWLVVLAQPLQVCSAGICVPAASPKAQRGCCQGPAAAEQTDPASRKSTTAVKRDASQPGSARESSCCKLAKKPVAVQSPPCCSVKKAPAKCGKSCGAQPAKPAQRSSPLAKSQIGGGGRAVRGVESPASAPPEPRVAQTTGDGCRARHEDCCCCWPLPKDIPSVGHKLLKPVLSAQLAACAPIQLVDAELSRFGPELIPSTWHSHSQRQSTLCAWLK